MKKMPRVCRGVPECVLQIRFRTCSQRQNTANVTKACVRMLRVLPHTQKSSGTKGYVRHREMHEGRGNRENARDADAHEPVSSYRGISRCLLVLTLLTLLLIFENSPPPGDPGLCCLPLSV